MCIWGGVVTLFDTHVLENGAAGGQTIIFIERRKRVKYNNNVEVMVSR